MNFPQNKQFAFTIIDDTDLARLENIRPIYDFLIKLGLKTTKTVWTMPSNDKSAGLTLQNYQYRQFIKKLQKEGFEIALHNVGSGSYQRKEILAGLKIFHQYIGDWPQIQINHSLNPDNIYWGIKRLSLLRPFWRLGQFKGDDPNSAFFWGDILKKQIKYVRNFTFSNLNIIKMDLLMPYQDSAKPYSNFWFSVAEGGDLEKFNRLVSRKNIDRLSSEGGVGIIYTHFASGFVKAGKLNREFQKNMTYLARQNGWFVPAAEILDFLIKNGRGKEISGSEKIRLEISWLLNKLISKFF